MQYLLKEILKIKTKKYTKYLYKKSISYDGYFVNNNNNNNSSVEFD